jgi:hypothetical protein
MNMKSELNNLSEEDIYSLMMFALYKLEDDQQYSSLSQLSYILDKNSLLNLCEFYGGLTIKIPTIDELKTLLNALIMFQRIDIDGEPESIVREQMIVKNGRSVKTERTYSHIKDILKNYNFNSGRSDKIV